MIRYLIISFFFIFMGSITGVSQMPKISTQKIKVLEAEITKTDTILIDKIQQIIVFPEGQFNKKWNYRNYKQLVKDVKKVLPYAKLTKQILREMNQKYVTLESEKAKKRYAKKVEKRLRREFEDELRELKVRQGLLLMKLVERETGNRSYDLIKEFKGSFAAFFWQNVARLFGSNLKVEYKPNGRDRIIEEVVRKVERRQL